MAETIEVFDVIDTDSSIRYILFEYRIQISSGDKYYGLFQVRMPGRGIPNKRLTSIIIRDTYLRSKTLDCMETPGLSTSEVVHELAKKSILKEYKILGKYQVPKEYFFFDIPKGWKFLDMIAEKLYNEIYNKND